MKKKKWLVMMLAAIMTVAMIPVTAFAAGGEASADGVEYATLEEALEKGGNVTLLRDVEVDTVTEIKNSTVLDLGGFTITNNVESERPFHVSAESFTVNASGGSMVIPAENTKALGFILFNSNCDFTINGGIYTGDTDNGAFFRFASGGTANVKISDITATTNADVFYSAETFDTINMQVIGGTYDVGTRAFLVDVYDYESSPIVFDGVTITADRGPCVELSGGNSTFTDCEFTVTGDFTGGYTWSRSAIGVGYEGRVTIKSGIYTANGEAMGANEGYGVYIYSSGGEVNIEDGTFSGTTASLKADVDKNTYGSPAVIHVTGGNFDGDVLATTNTGLESIVIEGGVFTGITDETLKGGNNLSVLGGTFDNSVKKFADDELKFERNNSGEYTYHKTLQAAMEDADDDAVITNIADTASGDSAYTATLVYNDGSGKSVQIVAGADGKITLPSLERAGYMFQGWDDGSGSVTAAGQAYTLTENKTLTAQWKALTKIKTESKPATCTEDGNIAYWYCPELDSYFSDEGLTKKITKAETIIEAKGHDFVNGVCTVCGAHSSDFTSADAESAAETGDDSNMAVPLMAASLALMIIAAVFVTRRKNS